MASPLPCPYCGKPATAWLVRLIDGEYWTCRCGRDRDPAREPLCHVPFADTADTEARAVANWNALVEAERARIDALVGFVSPLDYAWANRRKRHV